MSKEISLKILPDPRYSGPQHHPYHQTRYITTADCVLVAEADSVVCESGSIIATMTDCENQAKIAALIVQAVNERSALIAVKEMAEEIKCPAANHPQHNALGCIRCWCYGMLKPALTAHDKLVTPNEPTA